MEYVCTTERHIQGYDRWFNWRVYVFRLIFIWNDFVVEDDTEIVLPLVGITVGENHDPINILYLLTGCVWYVVCGLETSI